MNSFEFDFDFLKKLSFNKSFEGGLFPGSFWRHFEINFRISFEYFLYLSLFSLETVSRLGALFCRVNKITFIGGYLLYGALPVTISIATMPSDQISALESYPFA